MVRHGVGRSWLLPLITNIRALPLIIYAIPLYLMFQLVGLLDSWLGMILITAVISIPVALVLFVGFLQDIPIEMDEAGKLDGASQRIILWKLIFPMSQGSVDELSREEIARYSRHLTLPEVGIEGQKKLKSASVLCIGTGGLGSPLLMYLAAAGVGKLGIVDYDIVDKSNLQRQIIHEEQSIGLNKAESAKIALNRINSDINVVPIKKQLNIDEVKSIAKDVDVIVDCSDNFETRYALNKIAFDLKCPLVSGAAIKFDGQVSIFDFRTDNSPCYNCLFSGNDEEQNLKCSDHGVFSPLVGLVGSIQAGEVIKVLLDIETTLHGKLLLINHRDIDFKILKIQKDKHCEICS